MHKMNYNLSPINASVNVFYVQYIHLILQSTEFLIYYGSGFNYGRMIMKYIFPLYRVQCIAT